MRLQVFCLTDTAATPPATAAATCNQPASISISFLQTCAAEATAVSGHAWGLLLGAPALSRAGLAPAGEEQRDPDGFPARVVTTHHAVIVPRKRCPPSRNEAVGQLLTSPSSRAGRGGPGRLRRAPPIRSLAVLFVWPSLIGLPGQSSAGGGRVGRGRWAICVGRMAPHGC